MDVNVTRPGTLSLQKAVVAMLVIMTVFLTVRIWSRLVCSVKDKLWWDDWLVIPAWACSFCSCLLMLTVPGPMFGRHSSAYSTEDLIKTFRFLYIAEIVFHAGLSLTKFSALLYCKRLFTTRAYRFKVFYWVTFASVIAFTLLAVISSIAACAAPDNESNVDTRSMCFDTYVHYGLSVVVPVVDIITDLMILILPMPVISSLQLPNSQRSALYAVFVLGYLTWIASIGRIVATIQLKSTETDPAWDLLPILGWGAGEASLGITSICIPPCYGLYRRLTRGGFAALFHDRELPTRLPTHISTPKVHGVESRVSLLRLQDRTRLSSSKQSTHSSESAEVSWDRTGKEIGVDVNVDVDVKPPSRTVRRV